MFKELLEGFWEIELRNTASGAERKPLVEKDALPSWGSRKLADITRRYAVLLIDKVRERAPIVANRLQSILVRMFNFAAERGVLDISPLNGMRKKSEKARDRVLTGDEIHMLQAALDLENKKIDTYRQTKLALKMILLTGQRPGEVAWMPWDEIVEGSRLWIIPANRMKTRIEQVVPLPRNALEVLEEARHLGKSTNFVFGSSYVKKEFMTAHAMSRAIVRHSLAIGIMERWPHHDLRRTVRVCPALSEPVQ